jgi:hypothetical protein
VSAEFGQLPARLTDIMFLLGASIKSLRWDLINNPPLKVKKKKKKEGKKGDQPAWAAAGVKVVKEGRKGTLIKDGDSLKIRWEDAPTRPAVVKSWKGMKPYGKEEVAETQNETQGDSDDDAQERGPIQQLKSMILRDIFERLRKEQEARRDSMKEVKNVLSPMLTDRLVPEELGWEVLDRLNTQQVQSTLVNPAQVLLRVRFFEYLLQSDGDSGAALERIGEARDAEALERADVMKFMRFMLRKDFETRTMHWDQATEILNTFPVEQLQRLANDREQCLELLDKIDSYEPEEPDANVDAITVEDMNSMLMFLERFSYEELHEVLEYTQMLLDFLQLPCTDTWQNHFEEEFIVNDQPIDEAEHIKALRDDITKKYGPDAFDALRDESGAHQQIMDSLGLGDKFKDEKDEKDRASSSTETPASDEPPMQPVPPFTLKGRYVPQSGRLPTVAEDKDSSFPLDRRSRLAVGRLPSTRCAGGVGLMGADDLEDGKRLDRYEEDDEEWDNDDDDPAISDHGHFDAIDIGDIEVDADRNSLTDSDMSWDDDAGYGDPDDVSVGGMSGRAQSDISELSGFSSALSSLRGSGGRGRSGSGGGSGSGSGGRGENRDLSPPGNSARIAPHPGSSRHTNGNGKKDKGKNDKKEARDTSRNDKKTKDKKTPLDVTSTNRRSTDSNSGSNSSSYEARRRLFGLGSDTQGEKKGSGSVAGSDRSSANAGSSSSRQAHSEVGSASKGASKQAEIAKLRELLPENDL